MQDSVYRQSGGSRQANAPGTARTLITSSLPLPVTPTVQPWAHPHSECMNVTQLPHSTHSTQPQPPPRSPWPGMSAPGGPRSSMLERYAATAERAKPSRYGPTPTTGNAPPFMSSPSYSSYASFTPRASERDHGGGFTSPDVVNSAHNSSISNIGSMHNSTPTSYGLGSGGGSNSSTSSSFFASRTPGSSFPRPSAPSLSAISTRSGASSFSPPPPKMSMTPGNGEITLFAQTSRACYFHTRFFTMNGMKDRLLSHLHPLPLHPFPHTHTLHNCLHRGPLPTSTHAISPKLCPTNWL